MNEEYEEQVAESDGFDEETYLDSIGMLEFLMRPGKSFGPLPSSLLYRLLILAFRDANLSWKGSSSWKG
jgi:hypothetical protein